MLLAPPRIGVANERRTASETHLVSTSPTLKLVSRTPRTMAAPFEAKPTARITSLYSAETMSPSNHARHPVHAVHATALERQAPEQQAWANDDRAHELASEVEATLELDHFADPLTELAELADDRYPLLPADQQEALRAELQDRLGAYLEQGRARVVITDNLRTMMSVKRGHGVYTFRLHHMFVDAPPLLLRAVVAYAEQQDSTASEQLRAFVDANEDVIRQRGGPRPFTVDVEGRYHNLQDIFDALNADYFGGAIKARITWGPRSKRKRGRASIKLGSYTVEDELIRVHPVLDAADVPRHYLAWVVYHEMLRVYHTRAFRQAEAKFEQYAEAVLWERQNLEKLLNR
jgi:hypothetical protein